MNEKKRARVIWTQLDSNPMYRNIPKVNFYFIAIGLKYLVGVLLIKNHNKVSLTVLIIIL